MSRAQFRAVGSTTLLASRHRKFFDGTSEKTHCTLFERPSHRVKKANKLLIHSTVRYGHGTQDITDADVMSAEGQTHFATAHADVS
jgi:hypothetical protein